MKNRTILIAAVFTSFLWSGIVLAAPNSAYNLQQLNPDGIDLTQVTTNGGWAPTWSPDASKIAFVSNRDSAPYSNIWMVDAPPQPPTPTISNLHQYKSDGITPIDEGATTTEDTVVFSAIGTSPLNYDVRLQIEASTSTYSQNRFANPRTVSGQFVPSGTTATATLTDLPDGNYHWRARILDTQGNASDWREFGMAGNTDFAVHQVPLYTQIFSSYPSEADTDDWDDDRYGTGNYPDCISSLFGYSSISSCGCAIASAVMVLRYHGITTNVNGENVDPATLNAYLTNPPPDVAGYDENGTLTNAWGSGIVEYARDAVGNFRIAFRGKYNDDTPNLKTNYLDPQLEPPVKPVILYERSPGLGLPDHFIVASAKLAYTYAIRDPRWYNTRYLSQLVIGPNQRNYFNILNGVRLYAPTIAQIPDQISFGFASPVEGLITDPLGRRLGRDPITSTSYNEIPDSSYIEEGISDPTADMPQPPQRRSKGAWIPNPIDGIYDVKIIGTATGTFEFTTTLRDASGTPFKYVFNGSTQPNFITPYSLNYTPQQPNNIVVASQIFFGGFQPPIKADGTGIYKQGRTLPIKFQLTDASGTVITNRTAQLFMAKIQDGITGSDEIPSSTSNADTGNFFRVSDDQYIYNLDTATLTPGTWKLKATIDDGMSYTVVISIKL